MPRIYPNAAAAVLIAAATAGGCDIDRRASPGKPDAASDAGSMLEDASPPDAGFDISKGWNNVSFDTARSIEANTTDALQPVESATQLDFYRFEAQAGRFYAIETNDGPFTPNTVITLYDADRRKLAENDHGSLWEGDLIDARIVFRASESAEYFFTVEDRSTPAGYFQAEGPVLFYRVRVNELTPGTAGTTIAEPGATVEVEFNRDFVSDLNFVTLVGLFGEGRTDTFEFAGLGDSLFAGHALIAGSDGSGSTATGGIVSILDDRDSVIARIDLTETNGAIHPPIDQSRYRVTVGGANSIGSNGFYAIDVALIFDNPREQDEEGNDSIDGAEPLMVETGVIRRRSLILADVPEGDVDYFYYDAADGERISVGCEAVSAGSGSRVSVELEQADGTPLESAEESIADGLVIENVAAAGPGPHLLRISSAYQSPNVSASWVRCALVVEPDL